MTRSKVIEDADVVTYVVVRDPGDEAVAALERSSISIGQATRPTSF
jgi:hypothetical protein